MSSSAVTTVNRFLRHSGLPVHLASLGKALQVYRCQLHGYVLMTNHVNLLVTRTVAFGISHLMQAIGRSYVQYINRSYRRTGTLWEGCYKTKVIDSDAWLLTCMRYIETNPVRDGMVVYPGEYPWSSYLANAQGTPNALLSPHRLYLVLGSEPKARQHTYRELFRQSLGGEQIHKIRTMLNQEPVLGREDFKNKIARMTQRQVWRGKGGRRGVRQP